jgi:CheY-like chemotaxis protein
MADALRILLVDDDSAVRSVLRTVLRNGGMQVVEADGGASILATTQCPHVDVILCDMYMPGCDGLEVLKHLRLHAPSVPVIAMSGGSYIGDVNVLPLASLLGAAEVLTKPIDTPSLFQAIERAVESYRLDPQASAAEA